MKPVRGRHIPFIHPFCVSRFRVIMTIAAWFFGLFGLCCGGSVLTRTTPNVTPTTLPNAEQATTTTEETHQNEAEFKPCGCNSVVQSQTNGNSTSTSTMIPISNYVLPNTVPVAVLECKHAFDALTKKEKLYAHYLNRACWEGSLIILIQTSPESPLIFVLLHKIFSAQSADELKEKCGLSEEDFSAILVYIGGVLTNSGNYRGFGGSKIIPNVSEEKFEQFVRRSVAFETDPSLPGIWERCKGPLYLLTERHTSLGFPYKGGVTTYISVNFTEEDVAKVSEFTKRNHLGFYNNRARKIVRDGRVIYQVYLASVAKGVQLEKEEDEGHVFQIVKGDYSPLLKSVVDNLREAKKYAANSDQENMLEEYAKSFETGNLDDHKNGSRFWIKDKGPIVETYIGFIETFRDPQGSRGEFEGFVAVVNKEMSKKFSNLVSSAEHLLKRLPWPDAFEKDKFLKPDFTALDVLTFSASAIPCGINIPNYDEIRQKEGFKNVLLANVIPSGFKDSPFPFLSEEDRALVAQYGIVVYQVQIGLHELLGHGCGKYFHRNEKGEFDFDVDTVLNPLTGERITSWYEDGDTYDTVFSSLSSAYEECRAECVGLYLSLIPDVIKIFVEEDADVAKVTYVNWLLLIVGGVERALEMYSPITDTWLQAHSQARFAITRVLLEAGPELLTVREVEKDKLLRITLREEGLQTLGKETLKKFLLKLQVFQSTADIRSAKELFSEYTSVRDEDPHYWKRWRDIVLAYRQPRKMFVQSNTAVVENEVTLKSYEPTLEGLIESWTERYADADRIHKVLLELADEEEPFFKI